MTLKAAAKRIAERVAIRGLEESVGVMRSRNEIEGDLGPEGPEQGHARSERVEMKRLSPAIDEQPLPDAGIAELAEEGVHGRSRPRPALQRPRRHRRPCATSSAEARSPVTKGWRSAGTEAPKTF